MPVQFLRSSEKVTNYGSHLSSRLWSVRAAAQEEIESLGAHANDVLFAELEKTTGNHAFMISWMIFTFTVFPVWMTFWLPHEDNAWRSMTAFILWVVFMPAVSLIGFSDKWRKRTALTLALAERGDERAIELLLQVWKPNNKPSEQNDRIVNALTKLVAAHLADPIAEPFGEGCQKLIRLRLCALFSTSPKGTLPTADFTDAQADLIVTFAQYLSRSQSETNRAILARIVRASPSPLPNCQFVQEAVTALVKHSLEKTPLSLSSLRSYPTRVTTPTAITPLVNRRRP